MTPDGADPWLFRGGFLLTGVATLAVIAAVTHRGTSIGPALGNALFVWIGTRSYGLYLYHWPIYQGIRRVAGNTLSVPEFAVAMAATRRRDRAVVPPRRDADPARHVQAVVAAACSAAATTGPGAWPPVTGAVVIAVVVFAAASLLTAPVEPNAIAGGQDEGQEFVGDPFAVDDDGRDDDGHARRTADDRGTVDRPSATTVAVGDHRPVATTVPTTVRGRAAVPPTPVADAGADRRRRTAPPTSPAPAARRRTRARRRRSAATRSATR